MLAIVSLRNRTAGRRGLQNARVWQTWQGYYLRVLSLSLLNILCFPVFYKKISLNESEVWRKDISKQDYCHACHTRFAIFLPLPSCCVSSLLERFRITFTPNGEREFVPRDQVFPLFFFTVYCFYTKISSFMPLLSKRILLGCFYLLIFYSEKFSTDVCRLPYAVNVKLNLSIVTRETRRINVFWCKNFQLKWFPISVCMWICGRKFVAVQFHWRRRRELQYFF